jgi:lycopene elongase/hydratase (dihydrobisanhydrobacterioruberin-forming)
LRNLIRTSRPRFWIYTLGPFLVGVAAAGTAPSDLPIGFLTILAFYFSFPANLLIYGVNDLFDADTDKLNDKKVDYESRLEESSRGSITLWIVILNLPLLLVVIAMSPSAAAPLAFFIFLSIFYSAPPLRAKSKPFIDSAFNVLYALPGFTSYICLTGEWPPLEVILAAGCWTAAMHAYSAIPDIAADRGAGISTIATLLGSPLTLAVCGILFALASALSFKYLGYLSLVLGSVYCIIVLVSFMLQAGNRLFAIYRMFPVINSISGISIFWYLILTRS